MIGAGVFNDQEADLVARMYEKLSGPFGITLDNQHVYLRMREGSVHLVIAGVYPGEMNPDACFTCGGDTELQPADIVITHANGSQIKRTARTCTYCRVPQ